MQKKAFILFGGFTRSKYHTFIDALARRSILVLVIDLPDSRRHLNLALSTDNIVDSAMCHPDDPSSMLRVCKAWEKRYRLVGGLNTIDEFTLSSAAVLCALGLANPGLLAATVAKDKSIQRAAFPDISPAFEVTTPGQGLPGGIAYPAMVKAIDRHGGDGLFAVGSLGEARHALDTFHADERVCVEAYIDGSDFSVEAIVRDRQVIFQGVTEEANLRLGHHHVEMGNTLPPVSMTPDVVERAKAINRSVLEGIRFDSGTSHAEYRLTADGEIFLIELAARPPGDGIFALYELTRGESMEDAILSVLLGEPVTCSDRYRRYARQSYLTNRPGKLVSIRLPPGPPGLTESFGPVRVERSRNLPDDAPAALRAVVLERPPGTVVGPVRDSDSRCGWFIVDAPTAQGLRDIAAGSEAAIEVDVGDESLHPIAPSGV